MSPTEPFLVPIQEPTTVPHTCTHQFLIVYHLLDRPLGRENNFAEKQLEEDIKKLEEDIKKLEEDKKKKPAVDGSNQDTTTIE